jgi:release factor glutamine methyltransferase
MDDLAPEVINFEPKIALTDDADGLRFYKRIFDLAKNELMLDWACVEMSGSQSDKIIKTAEQYGFKDIKIRKDLAGIDRILEIRV